jgi:hypothetical protein
MMKPSTKRLFSGMAMLCGLSIYMMYSPTNIVVGIVGGVIFILGVNYFVDAKIEESK